MLREPGVLPYTRNVPVVVEPASKKLEALFGALERAGFAAELERHAGRGAAAIKVNAMGAVASGEAEASYTDPELVEALAGRLLERGFSRVSVVDSRLHGGESVAAVAARLGYVGGSYEIVDLSAETEPFDYGGVLGRHSVAPIWRDADLRISFAKNKTQRECFYSGAMANVLGCLPEPDKARWYRRRGQAAAECVRTALDALPVHFGLLDAWTSRDGGGGRRGEVRRTGTVMASANVVALDWVMGEKMGVDPALNPVVQEALHRWGRVELLRRGNLMPWEPWKSPRVGAVAWAGLTGGRGRWTIQ